MRSVLKASALLQIGLLHLFGVASVVSAQVQVPLTVTGNQAQASIELPGGFGAELILSFEDTVGLNPGSLEVWATLVNPLDPALLGRLPQPPSLPLPPLGGLLPPPPLPPPLPVTIPAAFPLLLRIGPSASSALSFAGTYYVSLYTHNLHLDPKVPFALHKAHDGGPFEDIMVFEGRGSYRAGGSGGDFSEFLIVVDRRPIDTVIVGKFDTLQSLLTEHAASMPEAVATLLQQHLSFARTLYDAGGTLGAIGQMRAFSRIVAEHSGQEIPDVWRAGCPGVANVAGLLRAGADTLRFSLDRKTGQ